MDLIQFNQEAMEEEMSILRFYSVSPMKCLPSLYAYDLTQKEKVLFSTISSN